MFGQSNSSPFGAPASSTPFGSPAPAAPFGSSAPPAFGGFGAPQQQQQPQPTFGGFGAPSSAPAQPGPFGGGFGAFGAPAPAPTGGFGAPSTQTPFGAPAPAPSGGLFGAPAPAPTGGLFGSTNAPTGFGASPPASSGFGGFGAPAPTSAFGTGSAFGVPAPAPTTGGLFGAPAPSAFGAPAPSAFGTQSVFGAPAQAPSLFGSPPAPSGGLFGAASAQPSTAGVGSKVAPFNVTTTQDGNSTTHIAFQSITAMPQYEAKSFEELRYEDYSVGNRGDGSATSSTPGGFGFGAPAPAPTGFGSTTGGFGAQPSQSTFGAQAPAPFGAPAPSAFGAAPAPSAFGGFGAPAPSTGGLFGAPAPAPSAFGAAPAPSGGLFGSAPASGGGLFGSAPAPAPAFGTSAPSSGGLFGAPAPSSGGLFGAPAPASGGLFGAPAPAPGGLFGAPAPAPGGLFGAPAPSGGGLFGSPSPAPAFGAPSPAGGGLFGAPAPAPGGGGLFGAPSPAPGGFGGFGAPPPAPGGLFGSPSPAPLFGATAPTAPGAGMFGAQAPAYAYSTAPPQNIIPQAADAALQQRLAAIQQQTEDLEKMEVWRGKSPYASVTFPGSLPESDVLRVSPYTESSTTYRASPRWNKKIKPRGFGVNSPSSTFSSPFQGSRAAGTPMHTPSSIAASSAKRLIIRESNTPKPGIRLRWDLTNGGETPISVQNGVSTPATAERLTSPPTVPSPTVVNMKEGGPSGSGKKPPTPTDTAYDLYNRVVGSPKQTPTRPTNGSYLPTLSKFGYVTTPSLSELASKSEAELAALSGFTISRDGYGSIAWEGRVDVRGINLDSIVSIERQDISVYDDQEAAGTKPAVGEKLNGPAVLTLFKIFPKGGANATVEAKEKFLKKLRKANAEMKDADFISYDPDQGIWKFRVHHFSRYRLVDDDSDDEDEQPAAAGANVTLASPTMPAPTTAVVDFDAGGRGGRSPVLEKHASPTRFAVPRDDDDDTDVEMMAEDDVLLVSDSAPTDSVSNAAEEAYKSMFLSPRAESRSPALVEMDTDEDDVFEDEGKEGIPLPLSLVDPPSEIDMMIGQRRNGICSSIMAVEGLSKSSVDMGIRMGRSFRIGWRPDGSFLHLNSGTVLVQSRPLFCEDDATKTAVLLLDVHSKHAKSKVDIGFTLDDLTTVELAKAIEEMVVTIRASVDKSYTNSALSQALALVLCLLKTNQETPGNKSQLTMAGIDSLSMSIGNVQTMEAFRRWLKGACAATAKAGISRAKQNGDAPGAIFAALSSGDIAAAASIATDKGYLQLAAMIVAGASSSDLIRSQVQQWYQTGASAKIDPTLLRIYMLLGGDFSLEEKHYRNGDTSCDWMMRLGLLLTYGTKDDGGSYDFASLIEKYDHAVAAGLAPAPRPLHCQQLSERSDAKSLLYGIIRLANAIAQGVESQVSLGDIVEPSSHTPSKHDLAGTFQLASVLSSLNCCLPLTEMEQARLLSGYASQLICSGKWDCAVYALLSSVGPTSQRQWRLKQAKEIVLQHYWPEEKSSQRFLTQKVGLPNAWLEEALADRFASIGDLFAYVSHLKEVSNVEARLALEESLVPTLLFQNSRATMESLEILKALSPPDESLTATVVQFFELSFAIKDIEMQPLADRLSYIARLHAQADAIERSFVRHKAAIANTANRTAPRMARVEVPMSCFLAESLSGISFLKLQLRALESGSSIWDESIAGAVPMKLASQLVANSDVDVKSNALKGYT